MVGDVEGPGADRCARSGGWLLRGFRVGLLSGEPLRVAVDGGLQVRSPDAAGSKPALCEWGPLLAVGPENLELEADALATD